ncbi:hypothetical protein BDB00DRAFT_201302 [Zychaea mexicana]|uniref:uncharacterized protein n=1 Tax=Zychaea mexicana TaxID=64656 RepID=UPI0022FE7049|nr:uncharacterized protein BDB00DRAFT_201302 [Zychaea mexicana]KAI9475358.1 hypothetical protein BDB00DRAFT_201302 [Zychaea mexicana]
MELQGGRSLFIIRQSPLGCTLLKRFDSCGVNFSAIHYRDHRISYHRNGCSIEQWAFSRCFSYYCRRRGETAVSPSLSLTRNSHEQNSIDPYTFTHSNHIYSIFSITHINIDIQRKIKRHLSSHNRIAEVLRVSITVCILYLYSVLEVVDLSCPISL